MLSNDTDGFGCYDMAVIKRYGQAGAEGPCVERCAGMTGLLMIKAAGIRDGAVLINQRLSLQTRMINCMRISQPL